MSSHHHRHPESGIHNDNGNTELPTLALVNSDSNDTFVGGGTLFGEVSLPNKFLSAKNSIEIHKNKVLTLNQSMPNVIQDRNHCLNNLISQNHGHSSVQPFLRTFLPPFSKPERSNNPDHSDLRHVTGQKSTKTVNWAPVLSDQNEELTSAEKMASPDSSPSTTNSINQIETEIVSDPTPTGHLTDGHPENPDEVSGPTILGPNSSTENHIERQPSGSNVSVSVFSADNIQGDKEASPAPLDSKLSPLMLRNHIGKTMSRTESHEDSQFTDIARQFDSRTSLNDRSASQINGELVQKSASIYKELFYHKTPPPDDDNLSLHTLNDTEDDLALSVNPEVDVARTLQLAENYMNNVQTDSDNIEDSSEEFHSGQQHQQRQLLSQSNTQVTYRDQNTGSDMATLNSNDNNLENHNYDTDDELSEPNAQTQVLTMVNPNDLPVPDPDYVARMVPPELHPFIAKNCKKDCRTWLWKSRSQRESCLAKQKLEQEKESSMENKKS